MRPTVQSAMTTHWGDTEFYETAGRRNTFGLFAVSPHGCHRDPVLLRGARLRPQGEGTENPGSSLPAEVMLDREASYRAWQALNGRLKVLDSDRLLGAKATCTKQRV